MFSGSVMRLLLIAVVALAPAAAWAVMTETKLLDVKGGPSHHLGTDVAIDGLYAIAGAPYDATAGPNAGKAVIYHFNGSVWVQQAELFPTDTSPAEGRFGWSVDISGDLAVVGAPYRVASGSGKGIAYVFRRSGTSWLPDIKLTASDGALDDYFGDDVAVHGDTVAVGAPGHTSVLNDDGAVYIYLSLGIFWTLDKKLQEPWAPDMGFGAELDVWGDWLAVKSSASTNTGMIHTYVRTSTTWVTHQFFVASDIQPNHQYGRSVALDDKRLVIGASSHPHAPSFGAGFVVDRHPVAGGWKHEKELLEVSIGNAPDNLGVSAGVEADLAAVGALFGDGIVQDSGLVYAYRRGSDQDWHEVAAITASDGFAYQGFGESLGVSGSCIVVGAPSDDDLGSFAGAVYIYCGVPQILLQADIEIICCVEIPDYTTSPVEFGLRFENVSREPRTIRRWVDLIRPDGDIVEIVRSREVEIVEGETYDEQLQTLIQASDPAGDYALVLYWLEGENLHTEVSGFSVVQPTVPGLPPLGLLALGAALAVVGVRSMQGEAARAGQGSVATPSR